MCKNSTEIIKTFTAVSSEIGYANTAKLFKQVLISIRTNVIDTLTEKGFSDVQIEMETQIGRSIVQKETTQYWANKMKQKPLNK